MKRIFVFILLTLGAAALFLGLVYGVLVVAHASDPAATTVHGLTPRRLWATTTAALALSSVVIGGLALRRSANHNGKPNESMGSIALVAGLIAVVSGGLNLAMATGGPGTGNGVVGAAAAFVLGLIGLVLGGMALARSRRFRVSNQ
jgi:hypothetical protein